MPYDPIVHKRRSIRLQGYDYSRNGLYFITICVQNRQHLFGEILSDTRERAPTRGAPTGSKIMILNDAGKMVQQEWLVLPDQFPNIVLHEYIIMPNHFHAIMEIKNEADDHVIYFGQTMQQGFRTIGQIVGAFKSKTTLAYIKGVKKNGWQRFNGKL